ncbi:unnamed protein product [Ixodes persulcatus]
MLRQADVTGLSAKLNRTGYKWSSGDMRNEMFGWIHSMLRLLMKEVHEAGFYVICGNVSLDSFDEEHHVSFCFRYAKENLEVEGGFGGFYANVEMKPVLLFRFERCACQFNLKIENSRGQFYDGAGNVSGKSGGRQALVQDIEQRALYVHCLAQTLNLSLQDLCRKIYIRRYFVILFTDTLNFVKRPQNASAGFSSFGNKTTVHSNSSANN